MTKAEIIEYLYDNNVRADITIEQMADDLADRKTESDSEFPNNCEDCEHWNDTERGFYKDMDGDVADIARAVYDIILRVQMLEAKERE